MIEINNIPKRCRINKFVLIFRCLKYGGQKALDNWLKSQEDIIWCVMENFDVTNIKSEIEREKSQGNLDGVFKKYCG